MILVFDTETSGLPNFNAPSDDPSQPHIVDIACSLFDDFGLEIERFDSIINPGVEIPAEAAAIHGVTTEIAREQGIAPDEALENFLEMVRKSDLIVGHNVSFDIRMARILSARITGEKWEPIIPTFCTMRSTTHHVRVLKRNARTSTDWKWPTLGEATEHFFGQPHDRAHRARPDCDASARLYFHLKEKELI